MQFKIKRLLILVASLCWASRAWSAACCGGGLAAPALVLSNDDKAQVAISYAYSQVADNVDTNNLWRPRQTPEISKTYKIEAAHIFYDRWQAGASVPVVTRAMAGQSSTGFGDSAINLGYEILPEWEYSVWRPKALSYLQVTVPTGRSQYESEATYQLDARGRGFWAVGLGTIFTKTFGRWDAFTSVDAHRSLSRSYSNSQSAGVLKPGYGGNLGLGGGFSYGDWRLGSSLTWSYEDPVNVVGSINSQGSGERYATAAATIGFQLQSEWTASLTYIDQTLFGDPTNTTLGRGLMLFVQRHFPR